ncbi:MAG: hypothetical protein P8170_17620 [Gemmatimonadota bacterium]
MKFHDTYARRTPFELAFPDAHRLEELIASVAEEAEQLGVDTRNRGAFMMLGSVGSLLRELQPPEAGPETFQEYGAMAFHAFHFHRAGRPLFLVSTALARHLVEEEPGAGGVVPADLDAPGPAGYVQMPRNLFWMRPAPGSPAEPVDGLFWSLAGREVLHLLLALGLRDDRPGLAAVIVPEVPWTDAPHWLSAQMRATGRDFATTLPGGELDGLYSIETAGEALKLVARLFRYVTALPESVESHAPVQEERESVSPSALPFARVDHRA